MNRQFKLIASLLWVVMLSCLSISFINAQEIAPRAYIPFTFQADLPSDPDYLVHYALDDDTAVTSIRELLDEHPGEVKVYVRQGSAWVYQATLIPSDYTPGYGTSIAIQGNTVVVGGTGTYNRYTDEGIPGALYVFTRNGTTWSQTAKIVGGKGTGFGNALDLDGNWLVESSYGAYDNYESSLHFYEFDGWHWQLRSDLESDDEFSADDSPVAMDGDYAITTANIEVNYDNRDVIKTYQRTGSFWVEQAIIYPPIEAWDYPVALDGNTAVVGPYVYITDGTTWTLQQTLMPNGKVTDYVSGVALLGDTLLLNATVNGNPTHAFVFSRAGGVWTQNPKLTTPGGSDFGGRFTALTVNAALVDNHIFSNGLPYTEELLVNGSFEADRNNDFTPDDWNRVNQTEDIRRCEAGLAFAGNCMFQFKGSVGEDSRLVQDVNLRAHDLNAGDTLTLTGFRNVPNTANATVRFIVTYAGGLPQDKEIISITSATTGYQSFTRNITLAGEPSQIRIQLQNKSTSGKIRFDALSLVATSSCSGCAALIPLPLPLPAAP